MNISYWISARTFLLLLQRELRVVVRKIHWYIFDAMLVCGAFAIVQGYILPLLGVPLTYGGLAIVGGFVSASFFDLVAEGMILVNDITYQRCISYEFTLPMHTELSFLVRWISYAIRSMMISVPIVFFAKLLLGNRFDTSNFSFIKWIVAIVLVHLFISAVIIWLASLIRYPFLFRSVSRRIAVPLITIAPERYPWLLFASSYPLMARIGLLNPFVYAIEMLRAAAFGPEQALNFWMCGAVLLVITLSCIMHALSRFKRRLDFV